MNSIVKHFSISGFLRFAFAGLASLMLVACGGGAGTVGISSGTALFSSAPAAITIAVGSVDSNFTIGGGTPLYSAKSSNASVATATISGNNLNIKGLAAGTATITISDAKGATITISVTVGTGGTPVTLFTTAPATVTVPVGLTTQYVIGGGTAPYFVTSNNTGVATVAINGNAFIITGVSAGSATVSILDSTGSPLSVAVTVGSGGTATPLFTTAPAAVTVGVGLNSTYSISGGKAPYTVSSSNQTVATTSITGNDFTITGVAAGSAQVIVLDSVGTAVTIAVTVSGGPTPTALFTTSPSAITIAIGEASAFTIGGGTMPYAATTSNASVANVSVNGSSLTITGVGAGTAQVLVFDAFGTSVTIAVTTSQVASSAISVSPEGATGNVGDVLSFVVSGGTAPYTLNVNNPNIVTVAQTGTGFTANLNNVGSSVVTVVDSAGQIKSITITVAQATTLLRLSPSAVTVAENPPTAGLTSSYPSIALNVYGGTGPYRAFTSDQRISSVSVAGSIVTIGLGSQGNRCITPVDTGGVYVIGGTYDVIITVVDSLGASATATMTIKDSGDGNPPPPGSCP
ncbi:hypothetical protein BH11PSE11_BH11PSE11_30820 [soil metagenome]